MEKGNFFFTISIVYTGSRNKLLSNQKYLYGS